MPGATTAAAIIAGGQARRFDGRDKSRLLVEGRTIIVRQIEVLRTVASPVVIIANDPERYADVGLPVLADEVADLGAIGGIFTALGATDASSVLTVACDLPFLEARLLTRLVERAADRDGAWVRTPRGVEPLLACYRAHARPAVAAQIAARRLKAADLGTVLTMAEVGPEELASFGPIERLLANVNTPADYARVQYGPS
jgi:molybdopterin-guanine dinucleotide biosynthesis protein A